MNIQTRIERLRRLGEVRFRLLIENSGGVYLSEELAQLLNITTDRVLELACNRKLIGFQSNEEWAFPVGQFVDGALIAGVCDVLAEFPKGTDDETVVLFFLSPYEGTRQTPLDLLKNASHLERLKVSARTLYDHGAR